MRKLAPETERNLNRRFVAIASRDAAVRAGGTLACTAAELHGGVSATARADAAWPRSATELDRRTLPDLSRHPGLCGVTVAPISCEAGWMVRVLDA